MDVKIQCDLSLRRILTYRPAENIKSTFLASSGGRAMNAWGYLFEHCGAQCRRRMFGTRCGIDAHDSCARLDVGAVVPAKVAHMSRASHAWR